MSKDQGRPEAVRRRVRALIGVLAITVGIIACTDPGDSTVEPANQPTTVPIATVPVSPASLESTTAIETTTTPATAPVPELVVPEGYRPTNEVDIVPPAPFEEGQTVVLVTEVRPNLDLTYGFASLCASVDQGPEVCGPNRVEGTFVQNIPRGLVGYEIELPQQHFGPTGYVDCFDSTVECHFRLRLDGEGSVSTAALAFDAPLAADEISFDLQPDPDSGRFVLRATGAPEGADFVATLDGLCGLGPLEPPTGSEALAQGQSWWPTNRIGDPILHAGTSCRRVAFEGTDDPSQVLSFSPPRYLFGPQGLVDCTTADCYASMSITIIDPQTSDQSSHQVNARFDIDENLPFAPPPSLSIVEPGPYRAGQFVTVEARNVFEDDYDGVGWCTIDETTCGYWETQQSDDGIHRHQLALRDLGTGCGTNRCYIHIASRGTGDPPQAVLVVPISE